MRNTHIVAVRKRDIPWDKKQLDRLNDQKKYNLASPI